MAADRRRADSWPEPGDAARAVSGQLVARIRGAIREAGGAIDFGRYMEMALYEPGLGYYAAGARKFGEAGDFVTAPELSPVFAHCVAAQCAEVLARLDNASILELGAGSGALAADTLLELERLGQLPSRYAILDVSGDLRDRQRDTLAQRCAHLLDRIEWLDEPPGESWRGVLLANEVADALPAARFEAAADGLREMTVREDDGGLALDVRPASRPVADAVAHIEAALGRSFEPGFRGEVRPAMPDWLAAITERLSAGLALFIDYGGSRADLYLPERSDGTLLCHYRHRAHGDPLKWPGLQDITAWVDFTTLAEAGAALGFDVAGYTTQAHFLIGCGMEACMARGLEAGADPLALASAVRTLTLPGEMGERFKVLGLTRGIDPSLRGFSTRDLAAGL